MKPFSVIAIPHDDILKGRLTEDIFAADLWEVFKGRSPEVYRDADLFFRKTYLTEGMKNLLNVVERRLKGLGGDPIIQIQTPFGGGKTHSLIALYHKAKSWNVNVVVIDGTALDPREQTIWGEIEYQLTGKIDIFRGQIPPGREKIRLLFEKHQPLLILMDEILQYTTKAAGIKVGDSNLAAQVLAFIHEFTGVVKSLNQCLLVLTLPSSLLEHYDENAEKLFHQLQKIVGRMEKIYSPVKDEEVAHIIRRRLFSSVDEKGAARVIDEFLDYAEKEGILPKGIERSEYRKKFLESYPFQPDVINILYTRWGSFPSFQRTRGVLRLLSLVVYSLRESKSPFIRLGDFNLSNDEIRRELIKHIGSQYDSVIASDITGDEAGSKKVDKSLGRAYMAYRFGTRVATTIFLYSFSGGVERGATLADIKLSCSELGVPSSIIVETVSKLRENLFYLQSDGRLFFSDQPNLNRIVLTRMENISEDVLEEEEKKILSSRLRKDFFDVYIWPKDTRDIPDNRKLKLIILRINNKELCKEFIEYHGERPRIYKNTLIFLCPKNSERIEFNRFLRWKIAWETIERDDMLALTESQRKEIGEKVESNRRDVGRKLRELYRIVYLPLKDGLEEIDLGMPTIGLSTYLDREIFDRLRGERIAFVLDPRFLRDKYMGGKEYVYVKNVLETFYNVPGELKISSDNVLKECIRKGVVEGVFGYGVLENGKPICRYYKKEFIPEIRENDILIHPELCEIKRKLPPEKLQSYINEISEAESEEALEKLQREIPWESLAEDQRIVLEEEIESRVREIKGVEGYSSINLELTVPSGKMSDIVRMIRYLKTKFEDVEIKITISARRGNIRPEEYREKIKEAIIQSEMKVIEEKVS